MKPNHPLLVPSTGGQNAARPSLELRRVRSVLHRNFTLRLIVPSARWPAFSFISVVLSWYAILWSVCAWENGIATVKEPLSQGSQTGFRFLGIGRDYFMWAMFPSLMLMMWGFRRFLGTVFDFQANFRKLLRISPDDYDAGKRLRANLGWIWEAVYSDLLSPENARTEDQPRPRTASGRFGHVRPEELRFLGLGFLLVLLFQVGMVFAGLQPKTWGMDPHNRPVSFWAAFFWAFFVFALIAGSLTYRMAFISYRLFSTVKAYADANLLSVVPNAPDGHGGLSLIGRVALTITYVLLGPMLLAVVWILQFGPNTPGIVGGGLCLLVAVVAFFLPLQSTHKAMVRAKANELKRISILFREEYERLPTPEAETTVISEKTPMLTERLDLMSKLEALYQTVRSMPVWPFDLVTLLRFLLVTLPPVLAGVLNDQLKALLEAWAEFLGAK